MRRFLTVLLILLLAASTTACSGQSAGTTTEPSASPETAEPLKTPESVEPEPEPYAPTDIFGSEFNPLAELKMPDIFTVLAASFTKGSSKLEGRNPYTLYIAAEGNMYAAVAYQADIAISGLSEEDKNDRFQEYSDNAFCEFTGTDGRVVTIRQTKPHDKNYENGACTIEIAFDVPAEDLDQYTGLIRDNYNLNALASVKEYLDIAPDFTECSIEVNLQNNETAVSVQYYVDDAEAVKGDVADNLESQWGEWYGHPSAGISYGMIRNTLVFDSRFGDTVLILQTSKELNTPLGAYVEPELSLIKLGFGFGEDGVCGVYEEREPHYKSVAVTRPEWGAFADDWNIELCDSDVNGYSLIIWFHADEGRYDIQVDGNNKSCKFDYFPATSTYGEGYPDPDTVAQVFNAVFGTQGKDFQTKPLAHFEQLVLELFGMSIAELYALPKQ